jgi:hypothetical protein
MEVMENQVISLVLYQDMQLEEVVQFFKTVYLNQEMVGVFKLVLCIPNMVEEVVGGLQELLLAL